MRKAHYHQGKNSKNVEWLIIKSMSQCSSVPIVVNREIFLKKPNFDEYFQANK